MKLLSQVKKEEQNENNNESPLKETIITDYHSLYVMEEALEFDSIKLIIDGVDIPIDADSPLINKNAFPKRKKYTLFINEFQHENNQLYPIIYSLRQSKPEDILEIRINSTGGYMSEGMTFFNIINERFPGRTVTVLDNQAYSMGGFLFGMGDERLAYEYSSLMFHDYSAGIVGKGDNMRTDLEHSNDVMHQFLSDLLVKNKFLTKKEFNEMVLGKDFWFGCEELAKRNIATHVSVNGYVLPSKDYLDYKKSGNTIDQFIKKILNEPESKPKSKPKKKK